MQEFKYAANPEVEDVASAVMDSLDCNVGGEIVPADTSLFSKVKDAPIGKFAELLGPFGSDFKSFVDSANCDHPSIATLLQGLFAKGSVFAEELKECCDLSKYMEMADLPILTQVVRDHLHQQQNTLSSLSYIFKKIPICLVKDRNKRESLRQFATEKTLDMTTDQECPNYFKLMPNSFTPYVRGGKGFAAEIARNKGVMQRLKAIGLQSQYQVLESYNSELEITANDTCFGFIRLLIAHAAVVLAKSLNARMHDNSILLPTSIFRSLEIFYGNPGDEVVYQPRIYPLAKVPFTVTPFVENLVNQLEAFKPIGGFPVFDNYYVIVPTIRLPLDADYHPYLRINGALKVFEDQTEAYRYFDKRAVEEKVVHPVILGENRMMGKCYFISYFV